MLSNSLVQAWFGPAVAYLQSNSKDGGVAQGLFSVTAGVANVAPGLLGAVVGTQVLPGAGGERRESRSDELK